MEDGDVNVCYSPVILGADDDVGDADVDGDYDGVALRQRQEIVDFATNADVVAAILHVDGAMARGAAIGKERR